MRKVLAITMALIIAAIVLSPALGYTIQSAGNQSYTATSGARVSYSVNAGVPAHNLTPEMITNKYTITAPAVKGTKVPYSIKMGSAQPYSVKLVGVKAVPEGVQITKEPKVLDVKKEEAPKAETIAKPVEELAAANATPNATASAVTVAAATETAPAVANNTSEAAPVAAAPVEQPKFTIEGVVFDDADASGAMDNNETGLANQTVNLEQPAGTVLKSATTSMDGKFMFTDLAAGEYTVAEVLEAGWNATAPAGGKIAVNITDASATGLLIGNMKSA